MLYKIDARCLKDINNITDKQVLKKLQNLLDALDKAGSLAGIANFKKMRGFEAYYRIKIADYRIGFEVLGDELILRRILHRKDIYRKSPPK